MHLKQPNEFEDELYCNRSEKLCDRCGRCRDYDWHRKMHEQVYHELLTLSGLNCRTVWDPEFRPELLTDLLRTARDDEAIARTMAFAGFEYRLVEGLPADRMRSLVVQSIDRGTPVPGVPGCGGRLVPHHRLRRRRSPGHRLLCPAAVGFRRRAGGGARGTRLLEAGLAAARAPGCC